MYLADRTSEPFAQADARCKALVHKIMQGFDLPVQALSRDNPGDLQTAYRGKIFYVVSGVVRLESHGKSICLFDDGDLVGLPGVMGLLQSRLVADSLIEFHAIDPQALMAHVQANADRLAAWSEWLLADASRVYLALGQFQTWSSRPPFGMRHFAAGEVMIQQGSEPDEVYAILQGAADVFLNGTPVGEVLTNEIFGAMAFLTGSRRSADVVAREACTVLVVPGEEFQMLLQSHPHIGMNLLRNMARQVSAMNQQVHDLLQR